MAAYNLQQLESVEKVETRVYAQLRQAIMQGQLAPGERLVQDRLAASLGVSRMPVAHALKRLETQGFVSTSPRGETEVVELSPADAWELYVLRARLQPMAARLAAARRSDKQMAEIQRLALLTEPLSGQDRFLMDRRFHEAVAAASGLPRLIQILNNLWELTEVYRAALDSKAQDIGARASDKESSSREHEALVAALRAGDARGAEQAEHAHLARVIKMVFRVLNQPLPMDDLEAGDLA